MKVDKINRAISGAAYRFDNINTFAELRSTKSMGNKRDPKVEDVAKKFEGMLLSFLMNEMMKSTGDGFMGKGLSGDIFKGLFVQKLTEQLASGRSMGLSDMVYEYFEKNGMIENIDQLPEKNE